MHAKLSNSEQVVPAAAVVAAPELTQAEAAAMVREREADAVAAERRANDEREVSFVNVAFLVLVDDTLFVIDEHIWCVLSCICCD